MIALLVRAALLLLFLIGLIGGSLVLYHTADAETTLIAYLITVMSLIGITTMALR